MPPLAATTAAAAAPTTTAATPIPTVADPRAAAAALKGITTVLLDQDGVLWRGDEDVPGAASSLQSLQRSNRRLFFVTNNSTLSRRAYAKKLSKRLALDVAPEQVVCSAWSAAEYLRSRGFGRGGKREGDKVLAIGESGLFDELDEAGIAYTRGPVLLLEEDGEEARGNGSAAIPLSSLRCTSSDIASFKLDPSIGAVVIGWSARQFTYTWVAYAAACLRELTNCDTFVVTNRDSADALPSGRLLPGTGAIVAAVEAAAGPGKYVAVDAGKGGEWLLRGLLPRAIPDFEPSRAAMVGDRLDTDVAFARQGGFRAAMLTLTGVARREDAEAAGLEQRPTHILPSIASLTLE